ncbi:MAG TPA: hypothetical protein VFH45_09270 [Acidimicrobiales bacterium]|nr:hypothetical protein [Acidimicrobiales bacterium]
MILALFVAFLVLFVVLPLIGMAAWALISSIVVGLIFGGLARLILPGRQNIGLVATCLAGLVGSIVGGFIGHHVIHVGHLATLLLEIGVSAAAVTAWSASHRPAVGGDSRPPLGA